MSEFHTVSFADLSQKFIFSSLQVVIPLYLLKLIISHSLATLVAAGK